MSERSISVALPVRNGENYLAAALDSILSQSFRDFDVFVSDNASSDNTPKILAEYAARDPRIKVSRSPELIPQQANMNRAVAMADTSWVKLFCHDDLMLDGCMDRIVNVIDGIAGSNVALIGNGEKHLFGDRFFTEGNTNGEVIVIPGRETIARQLWNVALAVPFPAITTATINKSAFLATGGFDERYVYFDIFCWLEMLMVYDYAVDTQALTVNRIHPGQIAQHARSSLREVSDFREFLPSFVKRHGDRLDMGFKDRLRLRLKPIVLGARAIAVQILRGRWAQAVKMTSRLPFHYWPLLSVLIPRALLDERRMCRRDAQHIPLELLYPV